MTISLSILGATGKMGKRLVSLASEDAMFGRIEAVDRNASLDEALQQCDIAIDFSSHEATLKHLRAAINANRAIVIGTTGHSDEGRRAIEEAAKVIPILYSPNFSFGIALCLEAVELLGTALFGKGWIDIVETHHVYKQDAPSGTALALARAVGKGTIAVDSETPRKKEHILIHSIRSGEVIGEHLVIFECGHERIELKHTTHSRDAFAQGALLGAKFLVKKTAGLYSLKDLFLNDRQV